MSKIGGGGARGLTLTWLVSRGMAARTDAALPMECTGSFMALRKHVKSAKDLGTETTASPLLQLASRSEREQEWDESKELQPIECHTEARGNQERISQEERNLNVIRLSLAKEQREIKTRERSIKAMEIALQEAMDRTADKERGLDNRIQDITRLEQRLHEALTKSSSTGHDPQLENSLSNREDLAAEETKQQLEEREALLVLHEQELALARLRIADRERHLSTKERVLGEKATELDHLQTEIEKKGAHRATLADLRVAESKQDLQRQHEAKEEELETRFQQQLACLTAEFEVKRAQLEKNIEAATAVVQEKCTQLAQREHTLQRAEIALLSAQTMLNNQRENLLVAQGTAAMAGKDLEAQRKKLTENIEDAQAMKCRYEEAEARLQQREQRLACFAAEVEAQSQFNAVQRQKLLDDRAALDTHAMTISTASPPSFMQASEATSQPLDMTKPLRPRKFTKSLFRTKPTTRSSRES